MTNLEYNRKVAEQELQYKYDHMIYLTFNILKEGFDYKKNRYDLNKLANLVANQFFLGDYSTNIDLPEVQVIGFIEGTCPTIDIDNHNILILIEIDLDNHVAYLRGIAHPGIYPNYFGQERLINPKEKIYYYEGSMILVRNYKELKEFLNYLD